MGPIQLAPQATIPQNNSLDGCLENQGKWKEFQSFYLDSFQTLKFQFLWTLLFFCFPSLISLEFILLYLLLALCYNFCGPHKNIPDSSTWMMEKIGYHWKTFSDGKNRLSFENF